MLNIEQIKEILPHRHPFLLVDRIDELEVGKRAVGTKCVTFNEPFFAGHFPQEAVMPGVLIIEALAQVGAVAILADEKNKGNAVNDIMGGIIVSESESIDIFYFALSRTAFTSLLNCFQASSFSTKYFGQIFPVIS